LEEKLKILREQLVIEKKKVDLVKDNEEKLTVSERNKNNRVRDWMQ
jgi:hypothetical protein